MNRTLRVFALPAIASILLAGCGSSAPSEEPTAADAPAVGEAPAPSDGGAPMDDGGDDANAPDESDAWPEVDDGEPSGPFSPEGAVGGTLYGSVYTLGAPEPMPDEVAKVLPGIGVTEEEVASLRVIPVNIDNTQGTETEGVYSATAVTEDGEQHEYSSISIYMFDVAEEFAAEEGSGLGDPPYDAAWEVREGLLNDVAPTAKATDYLVIEDEEDPDSITFTYFEIQPPELGEPIPMAPIS